MCSGQCLRGGGQWVLVLEPLAAMPTGRVQRDTITCGAAVRACGKGGEWLKPWEWSWALEPLAEVSRGIALQNTIKHIAAISACAWGGDWSRAVSLLASLADGRLVKFTITHYMASRTWGGSGFSCQAQQQRHSQWFTITYNAAIVACSNGHTASGSWPR